MRRPASALLYALLLAAALPAARAQVYSCVDRQGRTLTADRPILDCIDREQTQITPGGVRRRIAPAPTAEERAAQEEKARQEAEARARAQDQRSRDRALMQRYPARAAHDQERAAALRAVDVVIATAEKHGIELAQQRTQLDAEMEFYAKDPRKAPPRLKRQLEENDAQQAAQKRYIAGQLEEKQRIGQRYDQELARLNELWAARGAAVRPASGPAR